ncbi:hypothetical protein B0T21DRAFT_344774 [Apiosordaria backusii]|uniref:Uncharacterized protein n=1 Tax=Apiosordaria backusii TaxID=314023 RepID=A0AA40ESF4_9PEZI|nr:hypothetical protein B0T21DRAFT_344774 [Apiosordaria backusii]
MYILIYNKFFNIYKYKYYFKYRCLKYIKLDFYKNLNLRISFKIVTIFKFYHKKTSLLLYTLYFNLINILNKKDKLDCGIIKVKNISYITFFKYLYYRKVYLNIL